MIIMIEADEAMRWLERAIDGPGQDAVFAKKAGVTVSYISQIRYSDWPIAGKVAAALGLEKVKGENRYIHTIPDNQRY